MNTNIARILDHYGSDGATVYRSDEGDVLVLTHDGTVIAVTNDSIQSSSLSGRPWAPGFIGNIP